MKWAATTTTNWCQHFGYSHVHNNKDKVKYSRKRKMFMKHNPNPIVGYILNEEPHLVTIRRCCVRSDENGIIFGM